MRVPIALLLTGLLAAPLPAQTVEELSSELEAQKQINQLLKERIRSLEEQLEGRNGRQQSPALIVVPEAETGFDQERALERALERRGAAVLPAGAVELTPGLSWTHSGRDVVDTADNRIAANFDARMGLPGGWMIGAALPIAYRKVEGFGRNSGVGDLSLTVWKNLFRETTKGPSLVGSLRYTAPTGGDPSEDVPLGSGFHRLTGRLSAVKSVDPIAFYGDVSYTAHVAERISRFDVVRGPIFGVAAGASLAVTPDISASLGLDFAFERAVRVDGIDIDGRSTAGAVEAGLGVVLSRNLFLNLTGIFGITDDSPDLTVAASLPVRF